MLEANKQSKFSVVLSVQVIGFSPCSTVMSFLCCVIMHAGLSSLVV